jgi:general secretion pathway protein G
MRVRRESHCTARRCTGITLLELMVALGLVAVLSAVAFPAYQQYVVRAQNQQALADLREISIRITKFELNNTRLPASLAELDGETMLDPWGNPYRYLEMSGGNGLSAARKDGRLNPINSDYDLYSMGRDGASASPLRARQSRDDIVRGSNGAFFGLAADY